MCQDPGMAGDKPGPDGKGERERGTFRLVPAHKELAEAKAERLGIPFGDYVALLVAQDLGVVDDDLPDHLRYAAWRVGQDAGLDTPRRRKQQPRQLQLGA
jgi:hypothetical protein